MFLLYMEYLSRLKNNIPVALIMIEIQIEAWLPESCMISISVRTLFCPFITVNGKCFIRVQVCYSCHLSSRPK